MHIVVLCATNRGLRFLERLASLCPGDRLTIFSFREEPWEPKYLDEIGEVASKHDASFFETKNIADERYASVWQSRIDLIFVVSWRYLLPMWLMSRARLGAIVLHDSLLPAYRGFSPTVWSIINGESESGVTMFEIAEEFDSGDVIAQAAVQIKPQETIAEVMEKVTAAYLRLLENNIRALKEGSAQRIPQDHSVATYTCKRVPEDNRIDWRQSAGSIYNLIRAVTHPYTGAYTFFKGSRLTIWSAQISLPEKCYVGAIPGRVIEIRPAEGVVVLTGDGALLIRTVQMDNEPEVCAATIIKSMAIKFG